MLVRYLKEQLGGSIVMSEKAWRQLPLFDPERKYVRKNAPSESGRLIAGLLARPILQVSVRERS